MELRPSLPVRSSCVRMSTLPRRIQGVTRDD